MKSYKLIYKAEAKEKRFLFTNINIKELTTPISISREKTVQEETVFNTKKKSEQVEYEEEGYRRLKEREASPLIVEDSENRVFGGKMQDLGANNSCYFAFINTGTSLRVVPIRKWYRFCQRLQTDILQENEVESVANENVGGEIEMSGSEEKEEIDFDEKFDDDDGEEAHVFVVREKKLNSAGRKMRNIMESYEEKEESSKEEGVRVGEAKETGQAPREVLTKSRIREMFKGHKMSLRDLLRNVKMDFSLGEEEKETIKEFISESCTFETDSASGERYLILKR